MISRKINCAKDPINTIKLSKGNRMGDYKIWVDEEGIIHGKLHGVHTKSDAESAIEKTNAFLANSNEKLIIMDMSNLKRATLDSRKAHLANVKKPIRFKKMALFGASKANRFMANVFIRASGLNPSIRYFYTEEEALNWLKE
jgi:hypothetical protein